MLIEKLKRQSNFTSVEKTIAKYMLENGFAIRSMSISEVAEATYTSPASITRLCHKLGADGYKEFRILFNAEFEEASRSDSINVNLPFGPKDSPEQIAWNMGNLTASTVNNVLQHFNYAELKDVVEAMNAASILSVFSTGISALAALDFQVKMVRMGKQINVEQNLSLLPGYAFSATNKTVGIFISQSGESTEIVDCARVFRPRGSLSIALTANEGSSLARACDVLISSNVSEDDTFSVKIESFASFYAVHFILDCLYCWLYRSNYEQNIERSRANDKIIHRMNVAGEE
jgi:RpiR family carbohydrate utilization transcriptional regulator